MNPYVLNNGIGFLCAQIPRKLENNEFYYRTALILLNNKREANTFKRSACKYWSNDICHIALDNSNGMHVNMRKKHHDCKNVKIEEFPFDTKNKHKVVKANMDFFMIKDWEITNELKIIGRYIDSDYSEYTDLQIGFLNEMYYQK